MIDENDFYNETSSNMPFFKSKEELDAYNRNLTKTDIHLFGDKTIIGEIVQLLTYIRHGLKNNMKTAITVNINGTVANPDIMMDVNGFQVPDLVLKNEANIN